MEVTREDCKHTLISIYDHEQGMENPVRPAYAVVYYGINRNNAIYVHYILYYLKDDLGIYKVRIGSTNNSRSIPNLNLVSMANTLTLYNMDRCKYNTCHILE